VGHRAAYAAPIARLLSRLAAIARPEKRIESAAGSARSWVPAPPEPAQARRDRNATAGSASPFRPRRNADRVGGYGKGVQRELQAGLETFALFDTQSNALNIVQRASPLANLPNRRQRPRTPPLRQPTLPKTLTLVILRATQNGLRRPPTVQAER
jgi:hypothetical protein